mgnify:FL=1
MAKKNLPRLVIINWEDAISPTSGWTNIHELRSKLGDCVSMGIIVAENEKTITIVSHLSGDETQVDIDGSLVLDKSWIKECKQLPLPRSFNRKIKKWFMS